MDAIARGANLASMQFALEEHFSAGDKVDILIGLNDPFNEQDAAEFTQYMRDCGLEVTVPAHGIAGGPYENGMAFQIRRPVMAPADKTAFWPVLLLGLGGVAVLGWTLYKSGQIATDFFGTLSKAIIPLTLITVGGYVLSQALKKPQGGG